MIELTCLSPTWFYELSISFELVFAIVAMIVSLFSFKIYKLTSQKQIKLFGISFAFISISYFTQTFFNYFAYSTANLGVCTITQLKSVALFDSFGIYSHLVFMLLGLITLLYMTFKTKKIRLFVLLLVLSTLGLIFSQNIVHMFYLQSSLYLSFLVWHFTLNYWKNKQKHTLLIATAFLFMFAGNIHFLISLNHQWAYVVGHILELISYVLILLNFYLVLKK